MHAWIGYRQIDQPQLDTNPAAIHGIIAVRVQWRLGGAARRRAPRAQSTLPMRIGHAM
jgi:hypothetical protein